ncbi:hypothetical protein EDD21DRAFT_385257 [Dissophora ornata]|nr:hypothetical protein EDD21DRAFT_385257 [Dissophora ornata]
MQMLFIFATLHTLALSLSLQGSPDFSLNRVAVMERPIKGFFYPLYWVINLKDVVICWVWAGEQRYVGFRGNRKSSTFVWMQGDIC